MRVALWSSDGSFFDSGEDIFQAMLPRGLKSACNSEKQEVQVGQRAGVDGRGEERRVGE